MIQDWAVVLAGGDGTRLRGLTTSRRGDVVPKQFCALRGGVSLLRSAVRRAARVVPPPRILCVVAEEHREWWQRDLRGLPPANVVVQPRNRGTAAGILLPLLAILARDGNGRVFIVPSDHFVADEPTLADAARRALDHLRLEPGKLVLLGITPDAPDTQYGWILPGPETGSGLRSVEAFVEKPESSGAAALMDRGGVWNSFLIAAAAPALLRLYEERLPRLVARLRVAVLRPTGAGRVRPTLAPAYASLESADFSRELLQGAESLLRVLPVPACGWSDLGTPERVARCVESHAGAGDPAPRPGGRRPEPPIFDLAAALTHPEA